jgi:hypothetical protein
MAQNSTEKIDAAVMTRTCVLEVMTQNATEKVDAAVMTRTRVLEVMAQNATDKVDQDLLVVFPSHIQHHDHHVPNPYLLTLHDHSAISSDDV